MSYFGEKPPVGETIRVFGYFFVPDAGFRSTESSSTLGSSRHHMELVLGLNTMGCGTAIPRLAIRRQSLPRKIPTRLAQGGQSARMIHVRIVSAFC